MLYFAINARSLTHANTMHEKTFAFILLLTNFTTFGQEHENAEQENFERRHSLGIMIGHEHVFNGRDSNGEKQTLILPFWGLDYNFQFSPKMVLGLHTDIILETFEVEKNLGSGNEEVVERTRPIAPAILFIYKATEHWSFGLGVGGEFAKEENYLLSRLSIEYGSEIRNGWEVFGGLQYDFRWDAYDTWTIGLGIGKEIGKGKRK
jgi:hypothetical protein